MLLGRRTESASLDRLVADVRAGRSAALLVRGDPGIGKTALLQHLGERARDVRVVRVTGVESEMELPFAGVHQVCAPFLGRVERLPAPQRDALRTALGLTAGAPPDRFLVGLAVLSLLADAAEDQAVLCLVDDIQWLDVVSVQTLAFVARRLLAERIGMVLAVREPLDEGLLGGIPQLRVGPLSDAAAGALLDAATPGLLDEPVRSRIVAETRGNPLALLELPRGRTAADLAGGFALPDAQPLAGHLEAAFIDRVRTFAPVTQRRLLLAAAEPVGDVALVRRAAHLLGIGEGALADTDARELVEFGARVRFRHPLVRSAVYRSADVGSRREIHAALAEATDPSTDPDRRAWHRAHAAADPDEAVAAELERSAARAQARGGIAAAAAFLEKSVELTPRVDEHGARVLAAAEAMYRAGSADAALALLAVAESGGISDLLCAQLLRLRAEIIFTRTSGSRAAPLLLDAARRLEPLDAALARDTYLESIGAAIFAGRLGSPHTLPDAARAALAVPAGSRPMDLLLDGVALHLTEGFAAAVRPLRRALQALLAGDEGSEAIMGWLWVACPVAPEPVAPEVWDDDAWHELASRAVQLARDAGALGALPMALTYRAGVHLHEGELDDAAALVEEAEAITAAAGNTHPRYTSLMLRAWQGDTAGAQQLIDTDLFDAAGRGDGRAIGLAGCAAAVLHNGWGSYEQAYRGARQSCEYEDMGLHGWALMELVEAAVRAGHRDAAVTALERLEVRTVAAGTDWALGVLARSRALLRDGDDAEPLYREAIERLARTRIVVHLARTHLVYGEWLRRQGRRIDARRQLRTAHETFTAMGAAGYADRARRELRATGENVHARTDDRPVLTAQESQIARLAGDGLTNPEIGAQLFLSPHTVDWHLRKVFSKLGIRSRTQLSGRISAEA